MSLPIPDAGLRLADYQAIVNAINNFNQSTGNAALTATAAGTQATSQLLTTVFTEFSTVASTNDSCLLPPTVAGQVQVRIVANHGANTLKVFASGSDKINATAGATGLTVATNTNAIYFSVGTVGQWYEIQGT